MNTDTSDVLARTLYLCPVYVVAEAKAEVDVGNLALQDLTPFFRTVIAHSNGVGMAGILVSGELLSGRCS